MSKTRAAEMELKHEPVNDVPVLAHLIQERLGIGLAQDQLVPRHGNRLGLSIGRVATAWMTHILSECNHFMSRVQEWADELPHTLEMTLGQKIRDTDLGDERLAEVARELSDDEVWHGLERRVSQNMIRAYKLDAKRVRLDSTTASVYSVYSDNEAAVLFKRGYSKDHRPERRSAGAQTVEADGGGVGPVGPVGRGAGGGRGAG